MLNILDLEDRIKGLPDAALMRGIQQPSADVPQYLLVSELQRRNEMRQSYDAMAQPSSPPPVAETIVAEAGRGISGVVGGNPLPVSAPMQNQTPMAPPMQPLMPASQPTQYAAKGGIVGMQSGREVPYQRQYRDFAGEARDAARNRRDSKIQELYRGLNPSQAMTYLSLLEGGVDPEEALFSVSDVYRTDDTLTGVEEIQSIQPFDPSRVPSRTAGPIGTEYDPLNSQGSLDLPFGESDPDPITDPTSDPNGQNLIGSTGLPSNSNRAITSDISKLVDKLNPMSSDVSLPAGADFSNIAQARLQRSEEASTRMGELIQSIQEKAKSDALNMALINIGAGVASGDLAGGLEKAGSIAGKISSDARDAARALELQQITMAEEGARASEDIQIQESLNELQRFSVEQGIAKDQRDYNLNLIKSRIDADLGLQKLTADVVQSENVSKRSVLSLISDIIEEEARLARDQGDTYNAAARALSLYNPIAGIVGLDALSDAELSNALTAIGSKSTVETDPADLEAGLQSFISED